MFQLNERFRVAPEKASYEFLVLNGTFGTRTNHFSNGSQAHTVSSTSAGAAMALFMFETSVPLGHEWLSFAFTVRSTNARVACKFRAASIVRYENNGHHFASVTECIGHTIFTPVAERERVHACCVAKSNTKARIIISQCAHFAA